jgi:hypothetical protein
MDAPSENAGQSGQSEPAPTRRQVRAMAVLTVLGFAMFTVGLVTTGSSWQMWLFGCLTTLGAVGFWTGYLLDRDRR